MLYTDIYIYIYSYIIAIYITISYEQNNIISIHSLSRTVKKYVLQHFADYFCLLNLTYLCIFLYKL